MPRCFRRSRHIFRCRPTENDYPLWPVRELRCHPAGGYRSDRVCRRRIYAFWVSLYQPWSRVASLPDEISHEGYSFRHPGVSLYRRAPRASFFFIWRDRAGIIIGAVSLGVLKGSIWKFIESRFRICCRYRIFLSINFVSVIRDLLNARLSHQMSVGKKVRKIHRGKLTFGAREMFFFLRPM